MEVQMSVIIKRIRAFSSKYVQMRKAQKGFFRTKNSLLLQEAKKLEKDCDQELKELLAIIPEGLAEGSEQAKLFP